MYMHMAFRNPNHMRTPSFSSSYLWLDFQSIVFWESTAADIISTLCAGAREEIKKEEQQRSKDDLA
jgi:hypothetical protein